jgi:hypothetical protein
MLGAEQRHKFHSRRVRKQINRASAAAIHASLVCDQPDALPRQRRKSLRLKHINSSKHLGIGWRRVNSYGEPQMHTDEHR